MLKIGELEPNFYFSYKEMKYISFDKSIDGIRVLATYTNESQPAKKSFKKPVKQILHQCIEKEKEYIAFKNVQFDEWEPVRKSLVPVLSLTTLFIAPKTAMPDIDMGTTKKSVEKKRHPRIVNVLKKSIGATTITKRI